MTNEIECPEDRAEESVKYQRYAIIEIELATNFQSNSNNKDNENLLLIIDQENAS